jgi:hypothetical protein
MKLYVAFAFVVLGGFAAVGHADGPKTPLPTPPLTGQVADDVNLLEANIGVNALTLRAYGTNGAAFETAIRSDSSALFAQYLTAARDYDRYKQLASWSIGDYYRSRMSADSAPQISQIADEAQVRLSAMQTAQNQVIIEQNKQIIALLQKIAVQK